MRFEPRGRAAEARLFDFSVLGREAGAKARLPLLIFGSIVEDAMRLVACSLLAAVAAPASAQASGSGLSVTTGIDYSSGSYGTTQDTDILVVPLSARFKTGDWRLTATLPYLSIDGASSIVGGSSGGPIIIDPNAPATKRDGLGDLSLGATYSALKEDSTGFNLDLGASVKLPTASSEDGLGTGETDYGVTADISKSFGNLIPFMTVGYRVPGDPDTIDLNNYFLTSVGTSVAMGESVAILSYDYREATSDLAEDSRELFGAFCGPLAKGVNWTIYGSAGLSDGSPDFAGGLMLTFGIS